MIECLLMGDEIAEGMALYAKGCAIATVSHITSDDFESKFRVSPLIQGTKWDYVIISLGLYDNPDGKHTKAALRDIRHRIDAKTVYWLLPPESMEDLRNAVHAVAMGRMDGVIEMVGIQKNGSISPAGYKQMYSKLKD
jgi:hypothetical protein